MNKEKKDENRAVFKRFVVEQSQNHMNTTFRFELSLHEIGIEAGDKLLSAMHQEVSRLEEIYSEFRSESDLNRILLSDEGTLWSVNRETIEICELAKEVHLWSEGAFEPSFRSRNGFSFLQNFEWNAEESTMIRKKGNARLGFGAIGKGYALDRVSRMLSNYGFNHYRLSAGGSSIVISGEEGPSVPWKIAFAWEKKEERLMGACLELIQGKSMMPVHIGVSGSMEQGEHMIDQRDFNSPKPLSVLVTANSAARADAMSTAIYLRPELAQKWIDDCVIIIDNEKRTLVNQGFEKIFRWSET